MTGGLINIVSYNSSDLYLTGSPQITFYKMVYRRYTNFAMECIEVDPLNRFEFGEESELVAPRIGDLMHQMYLHLTLPPLQITRTDVGIDLTGVLFNQVDLSQQEFQDIRDIYMKHLMEVYRIVYSSSNAYNVTYYQMIQYVQEYIVKNDMLSIMEQYAILLNKTKLELETPNNPYSDYKWYMDPTSSNLLYILEHVNIDQLVNNSIQITISQGYTEDTDQFVAEQNRVMKNIVLGMIENGVYFCKKVLEYFFKKYTDEQTLKENLVNPNIRFAWVTNIGHAIIEYIDVFIGGKKLDRHLGIWFSVWHQLTYHQDQTDQYNKMIGNIPQLTEPNNQSKPSYDLYIPLHFWFNRFNGLSFPLIAMQYNDLRFNVRLRDFQDLVYVERLYRTVDQNNRIRILTTSLIDFMVNRSNIKYTFQTIEFVNQIDLENVYQTKNKLLTGSMGINYVYLDNNERRRFAQSGHEYLIETVQYMEQDNIGQDKISIELDMLNLSKEIVWVFQKNLYMENNNGFTINNFENYTTCSDPTNITPINQSILEGLSLALSLGTLTNVAFANNQLSPYNTGATIQKNPVLDCQIFFNNYNRAPKQIGTYYNTAQPYTYHKLTPLKGINLYSFSIEPLQHQPTGSANFSKLNTRLTMNLDTQVFNYSFYDANLDTSFNINHYVDFTISIPNDDLSDFFNSIDFDRMKIVIDTLESKRVYLKTDKLLYLDNMIQLYNIMVETIKTHESQALQPDTTTALFISESTAPMEIRLSQMQYLIYRTTCRFTAFSRSMNILRIIGGYGGLAYDRE